MYLLKTTLPDHISNFEQAKKYLTDLFNNGEHYHCEDSAADCFEGLHEQDAHHMDFLMEEVYKYFTENNADPCEFLLTLMNHTIE